MVLPQARTHWYFQIFLVPLPFLLLAIWLYFQAPAIWLKATTVSGWFFLASAIVFWLYPRKLISVNIQQLPPACTAPSVLRHSFKLCLSAMMVILIPCLIACISWYLADVALLSTAPNMTVFMSDQKIIYQQLMRLQPWSLLAVLVILLQRQTQDTPPTLERLLILLADFFKLPQLSVMVIYYAQMLQRILLAVLIMSLVFLIMDSLNASWHLHALQGMAPATLVTVSLTVLLFNHPWHEWILTRLAKWRVNVTLLVLSWTGLLAGIYGLLSLLFNLLYQSPLAKVLPPILQQSFTYSHQDFNVIIFFDGLLIASLLATVKFFVNYLKDYSIRTIMVTLALLPTLLYWLLPRVIGILSWHDTNVIMLLNYPLISQLGTGLMLFLLLLYGCYSHDTTLILSGYVAPQWQKAYWKPVFNLRLTGIVSALLFSLYVISRLQWLAPLVLAMSLPVMVFLVLMVLGGLRVWLFGERKGERK